MDFSGGGVSTIHQSGLSDRAAFFKSMPNSFANSIDEKTLQQQHQQQQQQQQQQQRTQFLFQQQQQRLQQPIESGTDASQSAFVSLSALNSAPEAPPLVVDRQSSTSTQSSSGWHDSPISNAIDSLSSPTSSIVSPPSTSNLTTAPPIDPLILNSAKETKTPKTAEDVTEAPKRRRGRPRLSDGAPRTAGAAAPTATKPQKKSTSRRTSTASASGADEHTDGRGGTINDKKNRIRARNREAAYKCRQKKQKGIEELQTQEAMAENINKSLNNEAAQLRGEILMLKNMVLQHGGCGCSYIEEYISGAAQNLVQSSMAAAASTHGGGMQMHDQNCVSGAGGEGYVDWKMFDMDTKAGMSLESESGFSGYDDSASHSARAQSQGVTMA
ncbi:bzip transcription factor [Colletotrichum incanum]|uniref:Bzip transcription factor n=1 Tax=Colletotrichum incanum TaxID=1573173 RepID=A0A167E639_COLIC|nr:bzip transcription factor [Colletotrichum incanum]